MFSNSLIFFVSSFTASPFLLFIDTSTVRIYYKYTIYIYIFTYVQVTFLSFSILYPLTNLHHSVCLSLFPLAVVCKTKSSSLTRPYLFPIPLLLLYTLSSHRLHCSRPRARRTTCVCVCYLRVFFFILLQVRFFILFRSRTWHNIKRTRFSYRRHTTLYVRFLAFYSMCTTPPLLA